MRCLLLLVLLAGSAAAQPASLAEAARGTDARAVAAKIALARQHAASAPDSAEALAAGAVRLAAQLDDRALCADANDVLADVQHDRGALGEAMEAYAAARECAEGDPRRTADAHSGLAMIYAAQGRLGMARDEYDRALALRRTTGDRAAEAETLGKLAGVALEEGRPEEAEQFARQSLSVGGENAPAVARVHLGDALRERGRFEAALVPLREALSDATREDDRPAEAAARSALARTFSALNRHADALRQSDRAVQAAAGFPQALSAATRTHAEMLEDASDPGAYDALVQHLALRDSVTAATSDRRLAAAQAAFQVREREREIAQLELESEVQTLALGRTRAFVAAGVLGSCLFLGLALVLWRGRREQAERLAEKDRLVEHKEMLVREVHHRVKNNLQVVASLLHLQARRADTPETQDVVRDVGGRIRTLALVHEKLYEGEDLERIGARAFFGELAAMLVAACALRPDAVHVVTEVEDLALPAETAVPLALATAELIANACEHAFPDGAGTVRLALARAHGVLTLDVQDDGAGAPASIDLDAPRSLGLRLVADMARQLGGFAEYLPSREGTHVRLEVPMPEDPEPEPSLPALEPAHA
ncbi:MAG: histidine kinase dimerization/phosphoacceptor domain -containing protein [Bacteroidota bacterium]